MRQANAAHNATHCLVAAALLGALFLPATSQANTRRVGAGKTYSTIRAAAQACAAGDTVLVDPGTYTGDVATWSKPNLVVKAADPSQKPHLIANGATENDMGVWHVSPSATGFTADGFEIEGGVSSGYNGAAIRVESGNPGWVAIRNCYFHDNQMNILAAPDSLLVEHCELSHTTPVPLNTDTGLPGNQHCIYVNTSSCRVVVFRYNYSHDSWTGHPFKSRARNTYVLYNRLEDGDRGVNTASYTIDIPDGGRACVIGNVIVQGVNSPNAIIVSYAAESSNNGTLDFYAVNNTIVNHRSGGTFINVRSGTTAKVMNNIFYGSGTQMAGGSFTSSNNLQDTGMSLVNFVNAAADDYHLTSSTPTSIRDAGASPGSSASGYPLTPAYEYVYDEGGQARATSGALDLGAFEYGSGGGGPQDVSAPAAVKDLRYR